MAATSSSAQVRDWIREGAYMIMERWTAFTLAIENGWGGPAADQKGLELYEQVVHALLSTKDTPTVDELAPILEDGMVSLFHCECDDGSIDEVAKSLSDLCYQCKNGQTTMLEYLKSTRETAAGAAARSVYAGEDETLQSSTAGALGSDHVPGMRPQVDAELAEMYGEDATLSEEDEATFGSESAADTDATNTGADEAMEDDNAMEDDDGWTQVSSKGRKPM